MSTLPAPFPSSLPTVTPAPWLRRVLWIDVLGCIACALCTLPALDRLSAALALPPALLVAIAVFSLVWAAAVAALARRPVFPRAALGAVAAGNIVSAIAALALPATGWLHPSFAGQVYIEGLAVVMAVLGVLQAVGLRGAR